MNKVYLGEDGIIHNDYFGDQTSETVERVNKENTPLAKKLREQKKRVLIMGDFIGMKKVSLGARKTGYGMIMSLPYEKIAVFGTTLFLKYLTNFVMKATGKADTIRFFSNKEEASAWLKS